MQVFVSEVGVVVAGRFGVDERGRVWCIGNFLMFGTRNWMWEGGLDW